MLEPQVMSFLERYIILRLYFVASTIDCMHGGRFLCVFTDVYVHSTTSSCAPVCNAHIMQRLTWQSMTVYTIAK